MSLLQLRSILQCCAGLLDPYPLQERIIISSITSRCCTRHGYVIGDSGGRGPLVLQRNMCSNVGRIVSGLPYIQLPLQGWILLAQPCPSSIKSTSCSPSPADLFLACTPSVLHASWIASQVAYSPTLYSHLSCPVAF